MVSMIFNIYKRQSNWFLWQTGNRPEIVTTLECSILFPDYHNIIHPHGYYLKLSSIVIDLVEKSNIFDI